LEHQPTALVRIPPVDYEEHSEGGTSSIDSGNLTDLDQQTTAGGSSSQASVEESGNIFRSNHLANFFASSSVLIFYFRVKHNTKYSTQKPLNL